MAAAMSGCGRNAASTMKALLRETVPDLDAILRNAKADPESQRKIAKRLDSLRNALNDEAAIERMMQSIMETSVNENQA